MIFNIPERRNAVSHRHVAGDPGRGLAAFEAGPRGAGGGVRRRGRSGVRFRRGHLVQFEDQRNDASAAGARWFRAARRPPPTSPMAGISKPTIAMIRGFCIGGGARRHGRADLRPAHLHRRLALRDSGGAARSRLRLRRREGADRPGRPVDRQGNPVHCPPVLGRRGAARGPSQLRRDAGGAGAAWCSNIAGDDRRQRAYADSSRPPSSPPRAKRCATPANAASPIVEAAVAAHASNSAPTFKEAGRGHWLSWTSARRRSVGSGRGGADEADGQCERQQQPPA